jgi:D-alanyl-D-alanine carboxypeptidase (penicillin-binding protein 5/6)
MIQLEIRSKMSNKPNTPTERIIVIVAAILCVIVLLLSYIQSLRSVKTDLIAVPVAMEIRTNPEAFDNLQLAAKSAIVWDVKNKKPLFQKNADEPLPLASLTKVMTAITAIESMPDYTIIPIDQDYLRAEGDTGLQVSEKWRLSDLLSFSLTNSSNDASRAAASVVGAFLSNNYDENYSKDRKQFVSVMNTKSQEIGLGKTFFTNENGLDSTIASGGAYGSATDVAKMFSYAISVHPDIMETTRESSVTFRTLEDNVHVATNTNTIINAIPGAIASKTGYTDLAKGNLVVAFDLTLGRPIVVGVLGSSVSGRFTDTELLIEATRDYFNQEIN